MSSYSSFYRSLFYFHASVAIFEGVLTVGLLLYTIDANSELFFKRQPDEDNWELIHRNELWILIILFFVGIIRTIIILAFTGCLFSLMSSIGFCYFLQKNGRTTLLNFCKAKATHRFIAFNCNCPCYRARPKLRFQIQLVFLILISCIRIATIVYCVLLGDHIMPKNFIVIVGISFVFLVLGSLLDLYHYRVWWHYKPNIIGQDIEIPTTPLSKKHKRYLPYQLLGSNRTGQHGDKLCSNEPCTNRQLEHILIFHLSDYQPQPRWSELKRLNSSTDTYIGFHRTSAKSALLIAHSEFRRSTRPPQMLGFGIYFARSIQNTLGKARFEGAIIAAKIRMGNVKEVTGNQLHTVRNTDGWHPEFDTVYYNHENDQRDEFCIYDESQILEWIMVIDGELDRKYSDYGMDEEFDDTKCDCI